MKKMLFLLFVSATGFCQTMNQYKYVIVPAKFDAQKSAGQFGLNNLTKLYLEKNGYTVFYDTDILPADVTGENCNKIYADVFSDNTIRKTKLRVEVKDCRNAVLFVSDYGESTEKDNRVSYNQALRAAFKSFDKPEYRYRGTSAPVVEVVAPAKTPNVAAPAKTTIVENAVAPTGNATNVLNAQPIVNGFQLVDTTPKIVLRIFTTTEPEIFIAEGTDGRRGIVLKKMGGWVFQYYAPDGKFAVDALNIKF